MEDLQNRDCDVDDGLWITSGGIDVADYPKREFSFGEIKRAGKLLSGVISVDARISEDVLHAFRVAHNWRMAHALPMIIERSRLAFAAKGGVVTAGRVKRMASIRKKLQRTTISLRDMQDLGGCRAVMPGAKEVLAVVQRILGRDYRSGPVFVSDYLSHPKPDGYRGVHVVVEFGGVGRSEGHSGQRLEIQVRTRLQHSWSTAVEVVGALLNQDFKGGEGDPDWRRLMVLMSDYYALCDGLPLLDTSPQTHSRLCREIREIDDSIGALGFLTAVRDAMGRRVASPAASPLYMLSMDAVSREIRADRSSGILIGDDADFGEDGEQRQSVIVSVDRADDLRRAFPNFYLDVARFTTMLGRAVKQRSLLLTHSGRVDLAGIPHGKIAGQQPSAAPGARLRRG